MSTVARVRRTSTPRIRSRKGAVPLVCLTAYTTSMARCLNRHVDLLLVGDSRGACVIVDLPFNGYQASAEQGFRSAARVMAETGASDVKVEVGTFYVQDVRARRFPGIEYCFLPKPPR